MENRENLRIRRTRVEVKGKNIEYDEYYLVDEKGQEIFDREIEVENDSRLYDIYKKQNNLLTNGEIKKIRQKYNLTQKDFALAIGVGEITVHRFENGSIQTEAVDSIMRLANDPDNMAFLLLQNRKNISSELYEALVNKIHELQNLKKHALIDIKNIDKSLLKCEETSAVIVANNIISQYNNKVDKLVQEYAIKPEYITPLKLQKLLYYVQGICLYLFGKKAFSEKILAWNYGPVVNEVYQKYKDNRANELTIDENIERISSGLYKIIDEVIDAYGKIEANELIDFTHEEDPWKNTNKDEEITINKIKEYFAKVYSN
ncbi:MAG: DUF4065 domain-containing protein [bacterium]|nr:DUF4065 domain-containing protein [bacterium]